MEDSWLYSLVPLGLMASLTYQLNARMFDNPRHIWLITITFTFYGKGRSDLTLSSPQRCHCTMYQVNAGEEPHVFHDPQPEVVSVGALENGGINLTQVEWM